MDAEAFARHRQQQEALLHGDILLLPRAELFQVNASFHEMLVGCSGNQFLFEAVRRQNRLRRLIEYRHQIDRSRLANQAREHLRLLDLVERGDLKEASAFLSAHLDNVRSITSGPDTGSRRAARPSGTHVAAPATAVRSSAREGPGSE
ncbi:FCD domain-containing protein [Streptomyces montanus]|uniref:FCD domain-containing protein n=1 Tax=Streptomyces montanus TaxID=2580423 RepID=UPI001FE698AF|nr:FCD domain-containing protein [Streptomyces montanus]